METTFQIAKPWNFWKLRFHIREWRWLKDEKGILKDYIRFWLTFPKKMYCYTMWLARAVEEYCEIHGDWDFAEEIFEDLEVYLDGELEVNPLIPDDWDYFRVKNMYFCGEKYEIVFDRDGSYYGEGSGLQIKKVD